MTRVRVESLTISLDGYGAGPNQDINNPLGVGATDLHQWLLPTRTLQRALFGKDGGTTGVDDDFAARGFWNVGAWMTENSSSPCFGSGWRPRVHPNMPPDKSLKGWSEIMKAGANVGVASPGRQLKDDVGPCKVHVDK